MILRYAVLGVIQGITEFLPISSSGHLVIAGRLLHIESPGVLLEALLHAATLVAILITFWSDIRLLFRALTPRGTLEHRKEIGYLIAGSVPIVVIGFLFRNAMDALFSSLVWVAIGLFASGGLLILSSIVARRHRNEVRFSDSIWVGLAQAASLVPGLSRSGATISVGVLAGLTPRRAARFSFLLAIPALLGATLLNLAEALRSDVLMTINGWGFAVAGLVALVVGLVAIRALLALVARGKLWGFGIYCAALGIAVLVFA